MAGLRRYRSEAGLTQTELAAATGNDPSYISLLERGIKRNPSAIRALAIIRVLSDRLGRELTFEEVFGYGDEDVSSPQDQREAV